MSKDLTVFDNDTVKSYELMAGAKIIGRECSECNLAYYKCKKENGNNPIECMKEGNKVKSCVDKLVKNIKKSFPAEFEAYHKCLDYNDYRQGECRETEKSLLECWNKKMGYKEKPKQFID